MVFYISHRSPSDVHEKRLVTKQFFSGAHARLTHGATSPGPEATGEFHRPPRGSRWSRRRIGRCFADTSRLWGSAELGDALSSLQLLHIFVALAIEPDALSSESFILTSGRPPSARLRHAFESWAMQPEEVASQRQILKKGPLSMRAAAANS